MKCLALELSSPRGSIALVENGDELFFAEFANDRKHSGFFFEHLQRCISERGSAERIVVGLGPGSYAGTRIAIAAAIGLAAVSGAELVGLPSIIALPTAAPSYAMIGDARRQTFFFAHVADRRCAEGPNLHAAAELQARVASFDGPVYSTEPIPDFATELLQPSAKILAALALAEGCPMTRPPLEPIYLREPHITQPKPIKR